MSKKIRQFNFKFNDDHLIAIKKWFGTKAARALLVGAGLFFIMLGVVILFSGWVDDLLLSAISILKGVPPQSHWFIKLHLLGLEALISGILIVVFGWLILPRHTLINSLWQKKYYLVVTAGIVLVVLWLPIVILGQSATIAGERYWWLGDDVMISMRYARNLANGMGLGWNPGERVEGYSNFLWTIYMTLVHLFPIPASKSSLVVLLTNIALAVAILPILIRLVRILGGGKLATIATLAGYVLSKNTMDWATTGFETVLLTFLFLLATYRVIQESQFDEPRLPTYLVIAIISLVRADAAILSALLYAVAMLLNQNSRKKVVIFSTISLVFPIMYLIFRIYYYGDILPNTAYLKAMNWNGRFIAGLAYTLNFVKHYGLLIVFAVAGSILSGRRLQRALLGVFLLYTTYIIYIGGDAWRNFRFFVPILPLLMALAFVGLQTLSQRQAIRLVISMLCLVTTPLLTIPVFNHALFPYQPDIGNIKIGLLLKHNTPTNSRVADFWAGSVFYFSERYAIDLLGKSDRYIARLPVVSDGMKPGHNKYDFDHSLGVHKPDIVIANFKVPVDEEKMRQAATGDWSFTGQLYFNSLFRKHYLPNPVNADTWRTIFVCDWSPLIEKKEEWRELLCHLKNETKDSSLNKDLVASLSSVTLPKFPVPLSIANAWNDM